MYYKAWDHVDVDRWSPLTTGKKKKKKKKKKGRTKERRQKT